MGGLDSDAADQKKKDDVTGVPGEDAKEPPAATPELLQERLEELLSKQNLARDGFIQQNMNAQMYIPLCVLASHHRIASLQGGDLEMLIAAARASKQLSVDDQNMLVKPLIKAKRNTLILHDLPDGLPVEELRDLFAKSPEGENLEKVEPDINHTAYATFKTDEAATGAALWLRSQKLRGQDVKCAVKSEHFMRSFFRAPPMQPPAAAAHSAMYGGQMHASPWMGATSSPWMASGYDASLDMNWGDGDWTADAGAQADGDAKGKGKGKAGKGKGKRRSKGGSESGKDMMMSPAMSAGDYPQQSMQDFNLGEGTYNDLEPGYAHEYRKYTRDEIIEVCSKMAEVEKPPSFARLEKEEAGFALFRQNPNKDWAPLPTPMSTFANMGSRKGSSFDEHDGEGWGSRARKRSSSWRRRSRSPSAGKGKGDWDNWDNWDDQGRWGDNRNWNSKWNDWGPKWQEKERNPSWAEKVRGGGSNRVASPVRWRAKSKDGDVADTTPADAKDAKDEGDPKAKAEA